MKKTILVYFLSLLFLFPVSGKTEETDSIPRGLFVSMIQDPQVLSSREVIEKLIEFSKAAKIHTLFVQIYRAGLSWFPSKVADPTPYEIGLKNLNEDPFLLLIKKAHENKIEVHAWLNMLSLSKNANAPLLKKYGPEILTRNLEEKKSLTDYQIDNQYFLEPGDPRVRKKLLKMVKEILKAYPELDGLLFDYIRYPDVHPQYGYTEINMKRFKKATGLKTIDEESKVWKDWKRKQVTEFLEQLVKKTHKIRPKIQVSATGCAPFSRAYHEAFQDWPSWIERGIVDFVTFMSYSSDPAEYERFVFGAKEVAKNFKKVNVGVPAYKLVKEPAQFAQLYQVCEKAGGRACVVFHYGSVLDSPGIDHFLTVQKPVGGNEEKLS